MGKETPHIKGEAPETVAVEAQEVEGQKTEGAAETGPEEARSPEETFEEQISEVLRAQEAAAEAPESAREEKSPETMIADLEANQTINEKAVADLGASIAEQRETLNGTRAELGLPEIDISAEIKNGMEQLAELKEKQEELKAEKEELLTLMELNAVLSVLDKLSKNDLENIMKTGKDKEGKPLQTKDGRDVEPEIAKKLAEAAFKGVKKITAAIVKTLIAIAGGFIAGIFSGIRGASEGRAA